MARGPQTLSGEWLGRLGVSRRDIGTGMGNDEVSDFSQKVDIDGLVAYHAAAGKRTQSRNAFKNLERRGGVT